MKPDHQTQAFLDHGPFGRFRTGLESRRHQLVVNDNIGSHLMCIIDVNIHIVKHALRRLTRVRR
jgi:hypothetical protein